MLRSLPHTLTLRFAPDTAPLDAHSRVRYRRRALVCVPGLFFVRTTLPRSLPARTFLPPRLLGSSRHNAVRLPLRMPQRARHRLTPRSCARAPRVAAACVRFARLHVLRLRCISWTLLSCLCHLPALTPSRWLPDALHRCARCFLLLRALPFAVPAAPFAALWTTFAAYQPFVLRTSSGTDATFALSYFAVSLLPPTPFTGLLVCSSHTAQRDLSPAIFFLPSLRHTFIFSPFGARLTLRAPTRLTFSCVLVVSGTFT